MGIKREIALLHAVTKIHKMRVRQSERIIRAAIEKCPSWYIAFSGGKDSTVIAALVRKFLPGVPLVWSDDEWYLPETEEYMRRMENLHHIRTNDWHAEWFQVSGDWNGIPDYGHAQGWEGAFLGLRQGESSQRRLHLRRYGTLYYAENNQQWQCNPISDWDWKDVWAYIFSNELDYNHAYDRLDEIGIEPERQRIGPFAVECVLGYGQLAILKRGWPELFNRFAAEFPEVRCYV